MTTPPHPREAGLPSEAPQPVAPHIGSDHRSGRETVPAAEDAGRLGEAEVVQRHRGGHVVEAAFGERQRQPRSSAHRSFSTAARAARRVQLILEPRSGDGLATVLASRLARHLRTDRYDVHLISADDPARMREQLLRTGRGLRCLIVVGGDATLGEVAGMAMELQVPLLPVPAGFGSMFARSLGYHATIPSTLELLERGVVQWIDAGRAGRSLFLSNQAFGFTEDVKTVVETAPALPEYRLRRYLQYWRAAARSVIGTPLPALGVDVDGLRVADGAVMVVVANVPTYSGFLPLTPAASPFDGFLDVFVVPPMTKTRLVALLLAFLVQAPGRWRHVQCRRASRVRVTGAGGVAHELCVLPAAVPVLLLPSARRRGSHMRLAS